jgi:tetratricopeptide (TPR) repeat protein
VLRTLAISPSFILILIGLAFFESTQFVHGQDEEEEEPMEFQAVEALYQRGQYDQVLAEAAIGRKNQPWNEKWWQIESQSLLDTGRYQEAYELLSEGVSARYSSIRLRLMIREAALYVDDLQTANSVLREIDNIIRRSGRFSYDPESLVSIGDAAILLGIEPRIVLENFYKRAQDDANPVASSFLAPGNLALEKSDFSLASKTFQNGLKHFPSNPELWYGLASSFVEGDRAKLIEYAEGALALNENHTGTRILLAQHLVDAEAYDEALEQLEVALEVNPLHPEALALKAVVSYLRNDSATGNQLREQALSTWQTNPHVDHLIGRNLSRKYWFKEGAAAQRLALAFQPDFLPAKTQLAQDLLRLGRETEGWQLADEVHEADPYNISAYNLVTLRDKIDDFETLETEHFRIRISKEEAPIYGQRAIDLLEPAYVYLKDRYGVEIDQKVTVEIYPNPADFEVRTFGMPGNPGYLGVCFGPVFTINSPATSLANWEAVMYHEFCHTITLTLTRNRMPRWLSEGISVYEERERNGAWGQMMTVDYRDRILDGRMQAISEMSAAFLKAQTSDDTQFAYYQSYLVVEYLFQTYGIEAMRAVLLALGEGETMNDALATHVAPLDELDERFLEMARSKANTLGGSYSLQRAEPVLEMAVELITPEPNYFKAIETIQPLIEAEDWTAARDALEPIVKKSGYLAGAENAHSLLAHIYRQLDDVDNERDTLTLIATQEGNRIEPVDRLLEIAIEQDDPPAIVRWANASIAIKPMAIEPWRALFTTHARFQYEASAIETGNILLELDPPDIAMVHYHLARQYERKDPKTARRHTLMALEEAPRFRLAYELLNALKKRQNNRNSSATPSRLDDAIHEATRL